MTKYALLIIDMQKAYFRNKSLACVQPTLVSHINQLIATASECSVGVYSVTTAHARDRSTWTLNMLDDNEGYLFDGSEDVELVDRLEVRGAEEIVKTRDSAFFGTGLAKKLHKSQVETLLLCGVSTHGCVFQTAADAYAENFRVILVGDAIASHDPTYHEVILELLEQEYRQSTKTTQQVTKLLTRG